MLGQRIIYMLNTRLIAKMKFKIVEAIRKYTQVHAKRGYSFSRQMNLGMIVGQRSDLATVDEVH